MLKFPSSCLEPIDNLRKVCYSDYESAPKSMML